MPERLAVILYYGKSFRRCKEMRYHIVPTYKCNLNCEYCYSKNNFLKFNEDMSWEGFLQLIEKLRAKDLTSVSFIGGEPTLWKNLPAAIEYLSNNNLKTIMYSNGILATAAPYAVIINMTRWAGKEIASSIITNIEFYKSNNTHIVFRCNIKPGDTINSYDAVLKAADKYNASISVAALDVKPNDRKYGNEIFEFCKNARNFSGSVDLSRPLPICMFSEDELMFLQQKCSLRSICNTNALIPLINPDGETFYPCNSLRDEFSLTQYLEGSIVKADYSNVVEKHHCNTIPDECRQCDHFLNRECYCGCFIDRSQEIQMNKIKE